MYKSHLSIVHGCGTGVYFVVNTRGVMVEKTKNKIIILGGNRGTGGAVGNARCSYHIMYVYVYICINIDITESV